MPRERAFGDNLLVSTSVHLSVGALKAIDELEVGRSSFIREAVDEKLTREEGFRASIERLRSEREDHLNRVKEIEHLIVNLEKMSKEVAFKNLEEKRDALIREAIRNVSTYQRPEDVLKDLKPMLQIKDEKDEKFALARIDKIWGEERKGVAE